MGKALASSVFSLLFFLALPFISKAQTPYPGCPNIVASPVDQSLKVSQDTVVLKCGQSCVDLTANLLQTGTTSKYKVSSIPFAPPFAFTAGTAILVSQDDVFGSVINLPFNFCFFGVSYNKVVVGANGIVTFNTALAGGTCCYQSGNPIPNTTDANCNITANANMYQNSIYGAFHDLDPTGGGAITCGVLGTAPCRTFVVNFNNMAQFSCTSLKTTQQIVIYETTNVVEVYIKNKPSCAGWEDGNAVIGIQNKGGTLAYWPTGRNVSPWTATNEAWRFTPDGPPNYALTWTDLAGNVQGTGTTLNICPPSFPIKYIAKVQYTNCDNAVITDRDTVVLISEAISGYCANDTTICEGDSATLKFTNTSPPGSYNFQWTGPNIASASSQTTKSLPSDSSLYVMTVTSTGGSNCVFKDSMIVKVTKTNPGTDGTLVVCETNQAVDLFTKLNGSPESGGSWKDPAGNPFTNPLDPATAASGDYVYTLKKGVCPAETAKVKVTINKLPKAGNDGQDTLCNNTNNGNLFNFITNEPTGGTWVAQAGVFASTVNPATGIVNVTTLTPNSYKYYYVVKGTAPCPNDTAVATVHVKATPTAAFPVVTPFCKGTTSYLKPVFTGVAPFTLTYLDCDGNSTTLTGMNNGDSIAISPTTSPCTYTVTSVSDGGDYSCTNNTQSTRTVTLLTPPVIQLDSLVCNATNTGYNAYLTLTGGDSPSYKVNNSTTGITGNKYKSSLLPGGSTYNFTLTDKNGCAPISSINGFKNCDCTTDAGTMKSNQVDVCGATPAVGTHNNNHAFDGNDTKNFVLHDNPGVSLGTVYAINPTAPIFTYDTAWRINYDQTYYISAIVGDKQTGNPTYVDTTNGNGCLSVSAGQPVQFHEIPALAANAAITQICLGDSILIDLTFTAGAEPYSVDYSENGVSGFNVSGKTPASNTFYVTPPLLGSNSYAFTSVKDKFGCTGSLSDMIDVTTVDSPVAAPETKTCNNINTAYTVDFAISGGDQPSYEVDGTLLNGASTFTGAPITSGTGYQYTLTDKNNCNPKTIIGSHTCPCVSKAGTMTQIGGTPQEFCVNATATVGHNGDQVFDGNDVLSFILTSNTTNPTQFIVQHGKSPSFNFIPGMSTGTVYYIYPIAGDDDGTGLVNVAAACKDLGAGTPIRFIALPTVSMTGSKEICQGDSAVITFTITGNGNVKFTMLGSDGTSQSLSFPAGTGTTKVGPSIASGSITYTVDPSTIYDSTQPTNCAGTYSPPDVVITVHPTPTAAISGNFTICQGEQITLPIVTTGDNTLTTIWGKSSGQIVDSSFTDVAGTYNKLITDQLAAGTHTFVVKSVKDNTNASCPGTVSGSATVIVQPTPATTFVLLNDTICKNDSTQIELVTSGNPAFNVYYHDNFGTKYSHTNLPVGSSKFVLKPGNTRTYMLDSITDGTTSDASARSCYKVYQQGTITQRLMVISLPSGTLSGDQEICFGESAYIKFNLSGQFDLTATYEIRNDETGGISTATLITNKAKDSVMVTPGDTTTYRLTKIQDRYGCIAINANGTAHIPVNPIPVPIIAASDTASCPPLVTRLINRTDSRYLGDYTWHYGNGETSSGNGADPGMVKTYNDPGTYDIRLEITSPQGCYKDTVVPNFLTVHPFPHAAFTWTPNPLDLTSTYVQFNNLSEGQQLNSWKYFTSSGVLLDTSDLKDPSYTFPDKDTGSYPVKLLVTTEFGCQDSVTHKVVINGVFEAYIPNTFSPNGDGVNDYFLPILLGQAPPSYELSIFNRWGERIFYTTNYMQGWDGTYQGEPVKEDVYVFHLKVRSKYNAEKKDVVDKVSVVR